MAEPHTVHSLPCNGLIGNTIKKKKKNLTEELCQAVTQHLKGAVSFSAAKISFLPKSRDFCLIPTPFHCLYTRPCWGFFPVPESSSLLRTAEPLQVDLLARAGTTHVQHCPHEWDSCKEAVIPPKKLFAEIKTSKSPCHRAHFALVRFWLEAMSWRAAWAQKEAAVGMGGGWSFAFLRKLRQCCSFRGNYANSCASKLVFVHENCLEFVASHVFPSGAESFLFLFLASFSASLKERIASDEVFHF